MANWTALSFGYGTKLTSTQMTQLFDNISAAFEGASGSPVYMTAGTSYYLGYRNSGIYPGSTSIYTKSAAFQCPAATGGVLRITFTLAALNGTYYGRIYRNGSAVGTERSVSSGGSTTYTEDISSWSPGHRMQIYCKGPIGSIDDIYIRSAVQGVPFLDITSLS